MSGRRTSFARPEIGPAGARPQAGANPRPLAAAVPGARASEHDHLRVALLVYRGNPRSGGQGVYTRYLSRELARQGHDVTVLAGQPWPVLGDGDGHGGDGDGGDGDGGDRGDGDGVKLVKVPSLDLYREPDPFRLPRPREIRDWVDLAEVGTMMTGGFPEPRTFSLRARRVLAGRKGGFDIVHDNQSFGTGLVGIMRDGWPLIGTCHHPVTVDRLVDLAHAATWHREVSLRRWYGFVRMQNRVARRLPRLLTVSSMSRRDIVEQMGVDPERVAIVPIGADHELFCPEPGRGRSRRVPGRVMTTASADVPLKGLAYLLEALAKVRTDEPAAHLVVVGEPRPASDAARTIEQLGLEEAVTFRPGVSDAELVELYREASVVAVPSLYEGFSLPAVEAMACEVPVVATMGGALPEVLGPDGHAALLVPPADAGALAVALRRLLSATPGGATELAARLGHNGRRRVLERFTWARCATGVVEQYRQVLAEHESRRGLPAC
jgi:glycosyltransferase involved in cell wall biosynthesis